jgi:hypothetical protein
VDPGLAVVAENLETRVSRVNAGREVTMPAVTAVDGNDAARKRSTIAELRSGGEYVLHSARMVGDEDDHFIWRSSRRAWIDAGAMNLARAFAGDVSVKFDRACRTPVQSANWKRQYELELGSVNAALEMLARLEDELDCAGGQVEFA